MKAAVGKTRSKTRGDDAGAAAVEFALIAPLLMALIFGIVEFGWLWSYKADLNNATAVAARHFILDNNSSDPAADAKSIITSSVSGVTTSDISICTDDGSGADCVNPECPDTTSTSASDPITVTISVETDAHTITHILPTTVPVTAEFTAICQTA